MYLGSDSQNQGESEVIDDTEGYRCRPRANGNHVSKHALEHLGYGPCHHMSACFGSRQQTQWILEAAEGKVLIGI